MNHPLLGPEGGTLLLLGNEAIVRGALEAGINVVTCYPGTPSSEVPDTFHKLRPSKRFYMEYSTNEKVALEVAAGAALGGALTLCTMKHVGMNVAADPLFTAAYVGSPGGLVIMSADDPGCHSSQNEQDNRKYARFAGLPCFEPATAQEAKDMARDALLLARKTQQPVMLRTTTRVSHLRGPVTLGKLPEAPQPMVPFKRDPTRFVPVPAVSRKRHFNLVENMMAIQKLSEESPWNRIHGAGKLGVVASGISRAYLHDALVASGWEKEVTVFELGFSWPLPEQKLLAFLRSHKKVLILEELEPVVENDLRALAQKHGVEVKILGKGDYITVFGEYSTPAVGRALAQALGHPVADEDFIVLEELPRRPPNLCAGCAHRAAYFATRRVFGDDACYSSDIGCYTLGMVPPLKTADFLFCMGSSVSSGCGFAKSSGKPVVAFIGDSTFFHSGITGLVNAVFNKHDLLLVILDNGTTAMTGHQPNPGVDQNILGPDAAHLDIEAVVRGCGITNVHKIKPLNLKSTVKLLEEMKQASGVRVIIAEEPCALYARRVLKRARPTVSYVATQGPETLRCIEELACPAFTRTGDELVVEESLCAGCMVCMQVTSNFKAKKRGM